MVKDICQWILYKYLGWKKDVTVGHPKKFIICLAPHTSNWDFLIGCSSLELRASRATS